MSGGKETPRQKMVGMMYLVLTALLALNISKDVLLAFVTVEEGLNATNHNFDVKNQVAYAVFDAEVGNDPKVAGPLRDKALIIQKAANDLCDYIDTCRGAFIHLAMGGDISGAGGLITRDSANTHPLAAVEGSDNYDIPTMVLIGEVENPTKLAVPLKDKIRIFKQLCIETITSLDDTAKLAGFQIGLNTEDIYDAHHGDSVSWEVSNYYHTTIAAAAALLAGIKNEIKTAESDVVNTLLGEITGDIVRFDKVVAKVVAPSSYILSGSNYEADLFVAAYSTTVDPIIEVEGYTDTISIEGGMGKYIVKTGREGLQEYKGRIKVKQPDGSYKAYPFEGDYMVAKPSMAISPTKMNVFYIGVNNPVDISVAGAAPDDVVATITGGGSIRKKGRSGSYIVKVKKGGKCYINVAIKKKDGTRKSMGKMMFRVKRVPSPQASYAGVIGDGKVSKGKLIAAGGVIPKLEDFVFDLKFPVVSWNMSVFVNGVYVDYTARGPRTTSQMKGILKRAKKGQKVMIEAVKVRAPDGIRKIPGCVIKVK